MTSIMDCAFNLSENIEYPVLVTTKVNGKESSKKFTVLMRLHDG